MIFALRQPAILLGLVLGFLVGLFVRATVQRLLEGSRRRGLRSVGSGTGATRWRPRAGWAAYLDPFGTVAAVLSGAGWGARPEGAHGRGRGDLWQLLAALVVHGALAAAGFAAFAAAGGDLSNLRFVNVSDFLHGDLRAVTTGESVAIGFAMVNLACGLLALTPIPPLELGVLLWSRLPRSPGARRLAYRLLEEHWGVGVVLLLLLLPLGGGAPPLLSVIDSLGTVIFRRF